MANAGAWRSWTVGVAVFALLLKAAVPMLASAAAHVQGVPVAEVCEVYGVRTVLAGPVHDHAAGHHAGHAGHAGHDDTPADKGSHATAGDANSHCALVALGPLASAHPAAGPVSHQGEASNPPQARLETPARDATALWVAGMKQGPPAAA